MALLGTLASTTSAAPGIWADVTLAANASVANGTSATAHTVNLPTSGNGSLFNPNYPVGCIVLNQAGVSGAANSGLNAALGISSVTLAGTVITVSFVNNSAGALNVTSGTRLVFFQVTGT